MSDALLTQLVAFATGTLLLSAVLQTWRRSLPGAVRLLVIQGLALAALVATLGAEPHTPLEEAVRTTLVGTGCFGSEAPARTARKPSLGKL